MNENVFLQKVRRRVRLADIFSKTYWMKLVCLWTLKRLSHKENIHTSASICHRLRRLSFVDHVIFSMMFSDPGHMLWYQRALLATFRYKHPNRTDHQKKIMTFIHEVFGNATEKHI